MPEFNDYSTMEHKLMADASKLGVPINGSIELLPLCNLNCKMCYVRLTSKQMEQKGRLRNLEEWLSIASQMKEAGVLYLLLTGGEPLLYPNFKELYIKLLEMGMIITINTNGTLIDENWADFFKAHRPRRINITIYGKNNETYQTLCDHPRGYDLVMNGIRLLKERNIDIRLGYSVAKANKQDVLEVCNIKDQLDTFMIMDTYMMPSSRERDEPYPLQSRLDPIEASTMNFQILRRLMGDERFKNYVKQMMNVIEHYQPLPESINICHAGRCSFTINWQGNMRPCVVLEKPEVNVFETNFLDAWNIIREFTINVRLSNRCNECKLRPICRTCMAAAYLETGKIEEVPNYLCEFSEETYRLMKEYENENQL